MTVKRASKEIVNACIITAEIEHNGYQGGDAGHGGFVTLRIKNDASTSMTGNIEEDGYGSCNEIELTFRGDAERDVLIEALEFFLQELKQPIEKVL